MSDAARPSAHCSAGTAPGPRPAAVLWDMDGTLVESEQFWDEALAGAARHLGGTLSAQTRAAMVGTDSSTTLELLFAETGVPATEARRAEVDEWLTARMATLLAGNLPWRPGARQTLQDVAAAGVPSALVTSTQRALTEVVLEQLGRELFTTTVCGDEVGGHGKPHPAPYLRSAELLGVQPWRSVAIEDSPAGAASASAAGAGVIVVAGEVAVPAGPGYVYLDSLVGLDLATLASALPNG